MVLKLIAGQFPGWLLWRGQWVQKMKEILLGLLIRLFNGLNFGWSKKWTFTVLLEPFEPRPRKKNVWFWFSDTAILVPSQKIFSSKNKQQKNPLRELAKSHKNMVLEVFLHKDAYWSAQFITAYICDYWIKYISQNSSNMLNCGCCCYSNHKVQSYREQSVMTSVSHIMLLFDLFRQYHRPLPNGYSIVITWALVQGELHCCIGDLKNSINVEVLQM